MNPYPSYKDSGGEWIGEIPKGWVLKKIKYLKSTEKYSLVDGPFGSNLKTQHYVDDGDVYIIESGFITSGKFQFVRKFKTITEEHFGTIKRSQCREGDIIISKIGEYYGMCGILPKLEKKTVVSGNSITLTISEKYNTHFIHQVILQHWLNGTFKKEVQQTGQPFISLGVVNNLSIPTPSLDEQTQIVSFLDSKTQKIDELLEKTEKKIELLKEKRTSLINHCVTKGLNPEVEMKDSGVKWLGEIPSHWVVKPLKYICGYNLESLVSDTKPDYELDYLEISDVNSIGEISNPTHYEFSKSPSRCRRIVKQNDIIISTVRTYLKSIGFIENEVSDLICSTGFCVVTPSNQIIPKLLFYLVRSEWFVSKVISKSEGVSYPSIQSEKLVGIKVVLLPKPEQTQIVEYLDEQTQKIDSTIEKETQRTELLKEYRQSLISEVVTGKVDVRDWKR